MSRRVSITDVARTAGVGIGTVSRVINSARGVSEEMERHVLAVIQRLEYHPPAENHRPGPKRRQAAVANPRVELMVMIRLGVGWMEDQAPVYSRVFDGIEAAANRLSIDLMVLQHRGANVHNPTQGAPPVGRIFFGSSDIPVDPTLYNEQMPAVWVMGSPPAAYHGDIVQFDHLATGQLAAQQMLARGHRSCAFISSVPWSPIVPASYRGLAFRHDMESAGGAAHVIVDADLLRLMAHVNEVDGDRMLACVRQALAAHPSPTALVLQADVLVPSAYQALATLGKRPQADIDVLALNNEPLYQRQLTPKPFTIDVNADQVGELAVETLKWRIGNPNAAARRLLVGPQRPH